jgi:RNA polymerase sigma-70 factor (ECF subfamily)
MRISAAGHYVSLPKMSEPFSAPTRWTLVWQAGHGSTTEMRAARESICRHYWPPVYAFFRKNGFESEDAKDQTQAFFEHLIEDDWFARVDKEKGRLRTFLLATLGNFTVNEQRRRATVRHGGKAVFISLEQAEQTYELHASSEMSAEQIFQRRWALTLLNKAMEATREEFNRTGKSQLFEALRGFLSTSIPRSEAEGSERLAEMLGMSPGALRTAIHRLRKRFGRHLRQQVATTLASTDDALIDQEMQELRKYV